MMASVAQRVIFQMQDVLGLSDYARMNTPATPTGETGSGGCVPDGSFRMTAESKAPKMHKGIS